MKAFLATMLLPAALLAACGSKGGIDAAAGQRIFASRCASCHQIGPYARAGFAPQLNGIVGRRAGSTADFKYSAALANAQIVWSEQTLRVFVQDPQALAPGTSMRFRGLDDERQLTALVAYLRTLR